MLQSIMRKNHHNLWKRVFMFTEVNCSGLKDSRFNEQLLLAALKMFVRETQRKREREDPQITQDVCEATRVTLFPEIMKN